MCLNLGVQVMAHPAMTCTQMQERVEADFFWWIVEEGMNLGLEANFEMPLNGEFLS